jgi:hypothetical protein
LLIHLLPRIEVRLLVYLRYPQLGHSDLPHYDAA